jgi:hypothetical protein
MENQIVFDGQQTDEHVLYMVTPHPMAKTIANSNVVAVAIIFYLILFIIASATPISIALRVIGFIIAVAVSILGAFWNSYLEKTDRTYITDRRIIRFETITPILKTKRALFWNEALKAKAFAPNFLSRSLGVGQVVIEPQLAEGENVIIKNVPYYEDLANYIDKILFTFKNKPGDISSIKPFVPKPKGQRGA